MAEPRASRSLVRRRFSDLNYSSSASTSPERPRDDDNDSIMLHANDSASSFAPSVGDSSTGYQQNATPVYIPPVDRLPNELLTAIFQRLPKSNDLLNCMLVSRHWASNAVHLLWHRPQTGNWLALQQVVHTIRTSHAFFDYHDLVKRLNLS